MKVLIVTRHQATVEWIKSTLLPTDEVSVVAHYAPGAEDSFDYVVSILPMNLVADMYVRNPQIRYYQVSMEVPEEFRGKELSIEQMEAFGARLVQYYVEVK